MAFFICYYVIMNRYRNKKITYNGMKFDSKKELSRFTELQLLERSGVIKDLKRQVAFVIIPKSEHGRDIKYIADFTYYLNGNYVVEDVKSPITRKDPVYRIKKRMMAEKHGIEIKET